MTMSMFSAAVALAALDPAQSGFEPIDALNARIAAALALAPDAQPVDPRIRLARCRLPVAITREASAIATLRCAEPAWQLRVPVAVAPSTAAPVVIARGEQVEIVDRGAGFSVRSSGQAMDGGALGGTIRVRLSADRWVPARVAGAGRVELID